MNFGVLRQRISGLYYFLLRLKAKLISFFRRIFLHRRAEADCLLCIHWSVCRDYVEKGREFLKRNNSNDLGNFFQHMAKNCDDFQLEVNVKFEREAVRALREIYEASRRGEIILLQKDGVDGGRKIDFLGSFKNPREAITKLDHNSKEHVILGKLDE